MKKMKLSVSLLAILFAVVGAFAFKPVNYTSVADDKQQDYVWIKYDCQTNPAVVPGTSGNPNFVITGLSDPAPFAPCGTNRSLCAVKYLTTQTTLSGAGNRTPNMGATQYTQTKCAQ